MEAKEIRKKYIEFFKKHGHAYIKSAPLIPDNDPTVLFTTAGMHPLVPYLMGEKHPEGTRLVDCQKCIRTGDIDEVGDNTHLTFFEMLGNWSLGDYFKKEAITFSFTFLTQELGIPLKKLAFSVFEGDEDAGRDEESAEIWQSLGVPKERIAYLPKSENWWGPAGQTGPCGPDTEMFYWTGEGDAPAHFDAEDEQWVEIWNDVFMQYNKNAEGKFEPLSQQNVDTGLGLERVTAVLQGKKSVYETELFTGIIGEITSHATTHDEKSVRIIADHMRAATFIMSEQISPSNTDQGYVLRRLLRRSIRTARNIGIEKNICSDIARKVIEEYKDVYAELDRAKDFILEECAREEEQFKKTLEQGEKEFQKLLYKIQKKEEHTGIRDTEISGKNAFHLYDTYGFPLEMTKELAAENDLTVDEEGFQKAFEEHQEKSRQGAEQKFKGGLADHSKETTALHTATHLLHQALRDVLGTHVEQKGSNITKDRLRFDFSHPEKVSKEQLAEVENIVNTQITRKLEISAEETSVEQAKEDGAIGLFEERYGDKVKVYSIGDFSKEICGGPHVENTGELGTFKIKKEEASSRGVRRIKAVLLHS